MENNTNVEEIVKKEEGESMATEMEASAVTSLEVTAEETTETIDGEETKVEEQSEDAPAEVDNAINVETVNIINAHFFNLRNMLKFTKDKDANVSKLTSELQTYRDGLEMKLFKSLAMNLIGLREDCKKSVKEFSERGLKVDESKKYLNYLVYDFEDLLSNLNIRAEEENVYYNNKLVSLGFDKKVKDCPIEEYVLPEAPVLSSYATNDVIDYLKNVESYVAEVLKVQSNFDKILGVYVENSLLYEQGIHQVVLYPVVNAIAKGYKFVQTEVDGVISGLNEENATDSFVATSNKVIELLDDILGQCNVSIESFVSDNYDTQKHRILKVITTESQADNGKVAKCYTDCYLMESRVIYPQKVDVFKYQEK